VWVDFCSINGSTPDYSFSAATISNATKNSGNGTVTYSSTNQRGFFIEYANATNAGTTVTATLSNANGKFNWCAYGSDYPPNVLANTNSSYTLAGSPPFKLIAANGTTQSVAGKTIAISAVTVTPATITDATGYPGLWCPYTGSDLLMDADHRCRQRQNQDGAYNWEAWIKDSRDGESYRIVLMPDTKWWLAQNVKYANTGTQPSWCDKDECGKYYTRAEARGSSGTGANKQGVCPDNWSIPLYNDYVTIFAAYSSSMSEQCKILTPLDSYCPYNDHYGLCSIKTVCGAKGGASLGAHEYLVCNDTNSQSLGLNDINGATNFDCGYYEKRSEADKVVYIVRCFRQL
jgi:uncharacterized protein (TIGR02145 family)